MQDLSIRLLTKEIQKRQIVIEIGRETVRRTLKKTSYDPGKHKDSAFPSETYQDL